MERLLETFQDRLAIELHLANVNAIGEANEVLQKLLPSFNARSAAAGERPEKPTGRFWSNCP